MKTTLFVGIIVGTLAVVSASQTVFARPVSPSDTQITDMQIKKFDSQLVALRKKIIALQEQYNKILVLRSERLKKISPDVALPVSPLTPKNLDRALSSFPDAGTTWKTRFSVGTLPTTGFRAFYFDSNKPTTLVKQEVVKSVGMNYAWSDGPGFKIMSEDFGGYWIGNINTPQEEVMLLSVSQSWSETRVILDGKLLYKGGGNTTQRVILPKGQHTLEVEYVNNWHTVGFSASLVPTTELPRKISSEILKNSGAREVWYAGVYESSDAGRTIQLNGKDGSATPKILVLASYEAVIWDVSRMGNSNIRAIIVSSFNPGTIVQNAPANVGVYMSDKEIPYAYTLKADCSPAQNLGLLSCEGLDDFTGVHKAITSAYNLPLTGFSGQYGAKSMQVPTTVLNSGLIQELLDHPKNLRKQAEEYSKKQSIENIF